MPGSTRTTVSLTSTAAVVRGSELRQLLQLRVDPVLVWHVRVLERRGEWHRRNVGPRHPRDGRIKVEHALLADRGGDLGARPVGPVVLIEDERLAGLANRRQDRLLVERRDRANVDPLYRD